MASLVTDNDDTTSTTSDNSTINTFVSTINYNLSKGYENLTQQAKKQAIERIVAMANFELTKLDEEVVSELQHFEELPGLSLAIC